jgi:ferredoxin-NADP reductase
MAATEFKCTVKSFRMLTPTVFETTFEPNAPLSFEAGQFISVIIPGAGPGGRNLRRAYSIASAPQVKPVELCIKLVEGGPGTNYLYKLREGDVFTGMAPYGDFVYEPREGRHAMFIATGTGIAPFRSMAYAETYRSNPPLSTTCLLGVRTENELLYLDLDGVVPHFKLVATVSQPEPGYTGYKGRVTDYMRSLGVTYPWQETEFYLCGNGAMISEVKAMLADHGVAKESIHQEKYY